MGVGLTPAARCDCHAAGAAPCRRVSPPAGPDSRGGRSPAGHRRGRACPPPLPVARAGGRTMGPAR